MSTVNRLKNKARQPESKDSQKQQQPASTPTLKSQSSISSHMGHSERRTKAYNVSSHSKEAEREYESYQQFSECNPAGMASSMAVFPHSADMNDNFNIPLCVVFSPMLALENQAEVMEKSADRIPRCATCKAYMNCYNTVEKKKFDCFFCNRATHLDPNYSPHEAPNLEFQSSIYQALGPSNFYPKEPLEEAFIFMVDISHESFSSRMIYYAVAAMREVLSRPELDDLLIVFFAYDDLVYYYDLGGEEAKCQVLDQTIEASSALVSNPKCLKDTRTNLLLLLDSLEETCRQNPRKGYNFSRCLEFVVGSTKQLGGKYFILQSNEAFSKEPLLMEINPNSKSSEQNLYNTKSQSFIESTNKQFFDKYVEQLLKSDCSLSFFAFSAFFKNFRVIHDTLKLTCSEMKLYSKDSPTDLEKFYYDLTYLLGATYFKNVMVELVVSSGWNLNGLYGNYHRLKETITFQMNVLEPSRKLTAVVNPAPNLQPSPFFGLQVITNYRYRRQSFISVASYIQPVTGYMDKLYSSIDAPVSIVCLAKKFLSALRMEPIEVVRKRMLETSRKIYLSALDVFKKHEKLPDPVISILMASLSMLKSAHSHPELINNTPILDRVIGERNAFQFSGPAEVANFFSPYLFDLSNLEPWMCQEEFVYPPTVEPRFQNIREGLFLLDNGISLYLFVAKQCDPGLLQEVFGKAHLTRYDALSEQVVNEQGGERAGQVRSLVRVLREQKPTGWVPLQVVRCGENSGQQRNFYLNFHLEKYQQFRGFKLSFEEFLATLSRAGI